MKKIILLAATAMLISTPALACGGKSCGLKNCDYKSKQVEKSAKGWAKGSDYKKSKHYAIPGSSQGYLRNILEKSEQLALSDGQLQQVKQLLSSVEADESKNHSEAKREVALFRSSLHNGAVKEREIKAYAKHMGELRRARLETNLLASVKASRLLSDEQKSKLYAGKKAAGSNK